MAETYRTNLESVDPNADSFDFTGLKSFPPKGLRVHESRDYFHATRETARGTTHFFIVKKDSRFRLYSMSNQTAHTIGLELCKPDNLLLERDNLAAVLRLIGYNT